MAEQPGEGGWRGGGDWGGAEVAQRARREEVRKRSGPGCAARGSPRVGCEQLSDSISAVWLSETSSSDPLLAEAEELRHRQQDLT